MSDIVERLNRAGDLAIPGETCGLFYDAAEEIERLRLTDEEQSLIRRLAEECEDSHPRAWTNRALTADDRATLRGLLDRCATGSGESHE